MIFSVQTANIDDSKGNAVKLRCPSCRQRGTFDSLMQHDVNVLTASAKDRIIFGQRCCPDPECRAHVFFALDKLTRRILVSYPTERIDFDPTDIPVDVLSSFEEAITCHANNCYVAAAIMVRKTLEEICRERGAEANNLKQRLAALKSKVVIPQELLDGLDDLRLLGNDAAHIESQQYDKIGQEEVDVGIAITKEVLKAVYQYASLIGRLQKLKKNPTP
ncbi:MAG TPA: DUF4145 domain-containing protein [Pyrinomonadaceae bacterium]|jgi:hypothetical protein|nr:DUF4145 domain-containing protein [Pyrinomonadaceae bacterium]